MKVLHVSPSYKPAYCYGGPIMSVAKLCEELRKQNTDTLVLTTRANGSEELSLKSGSMRTVGGVKVFYFDRFTKDHTHFSPGVLVALYRIIKKSKYKNQKLVIHIHSWWNLVAVLSTLLAVICKIPVIVSPRGMLTNYTLSFRNTFPKKLIHKLIGSFLLQRSHIHATSQQEADNIKEHLLTSKITIIPNIVDLPCTAVSGMINPASANLKLKITESGRISQQTSGLNLLYLSRLDKKKGLELLFKALSELTFDWRLSIAGDGTADYIRQLRQLSCILNINSRISWLGHIENERKYSIMFHHDLLVLPSKNENFANVVLECLAVGTPVLISDKVGLATYVKQSDLGWVCKAELGELIKMLDAVNNDPLKRHRIRQLAPDQIKADFIKDSIINEYLQLYHTSLPSN